MLKRVFFCGVFVLSALGTISATVVAASSLTERMESSRMTILKTDLSTGRVMCVEHQSWMTVTSEVRGLQPGDIVRVDQRGGDARLVVLRTAAEELASPE